MNCLYVCLSFFRRPLLYNGCFYISRCLCVSLSVHIACYCVRLRKNCDCLGMFEKCAPVYLKNCQNWLASIWAISVQIFSPAIYSLWATMWATALNINCRSARTKQKHFAHFTILRLKLCVTWKLTVNCSFAGQWRVSQRKIRDMLRRLLCGYLRNIHILHKQF